MFQRQTQISPMIVSNMVQTQDEVLITNDLPIAGSRNLCQVFMTPLKFIRTL